MEVWAPAAGCCGSSATTRPPGGAENIAFSTSPTRFGGGRPARKGGQRPLGWGEVVGRWRSCRGSGSRPVRASRGEVQDGAVQDVLFGQRCVGRHWLARRRRQRPRQRGVRLAVTELTREIDQRRQQLPDGSIRRQREITPAAGTHDRDQGRPDAQNDLLPFEDSRVAENTRDATAVEDRFRYPSGLRLGPRGPGLGSG